MATKKENKTKASTTNKAEDSGFFTEIYESIVEGATNAFEDAKKELFKSIKDGTYELVMRNIRDLLGVFGLRLVLHHVSRTTIISSGSVLPAAATSTSIAASVMVGGVLFVVAGGVCYAIMRDKKAKEEDRAWIVEKMSESADYATDSFSDGWEYLKNILSSNDEKNIATKSTTSKKKLPAKKKSPAKKKTSVKKKAVAKNKPAAKKKVTPKKDSTKKPAAKKSKTAVKKNTATKKKTDAKKKPVKNKRK